MLINIFIAEIGETTCIGETKTPERKPRIQILGPTFIEDKDGIWKAEDGKVIINNDVEENPFLIETEVDGPVSNLTVGLKNGHSSGVVSIF